jgi:hypothetical protein
MIIITDTKMQILLLLFFDLEKENEKILLWNQDMVTLDVDLEQHGIIIMSQIKYQSQNKNDDALKNNFLIQFV